MLEEQNKKTLIIISVDNPLADPVDLPLFSFHLQKGIEVTLSTMKKSPLDHSMGLLVKKEEGSLSRSISTARRERFCQPRHLLYGELLL